MRRIIIIAASGAMALVLSTASAAPAGAVLLPPYERSDFSAAGSILLPCEVRAEERDGSPDAARGRFELRARSDVAGCAMHGVSREEVWSLGAVPPALVGAPVEVTVSYSLERAEATASGTAERRAAAVLRLDGAAAPIVLAAVACDGAECARDGAGAGEHVARLLLEEAPASLTLTVSVETAVREGTGAVALDVAGHVRAVAVAPAA